MFSWLFGSKPERWREFCVHMKALTTIAIDEREECNPAILAYIKHHKLHLDDVKELLRHDVVRELNLALEEPSAETWSRRIDGEAAYIPTQTEEFYRPRFERVIHRLEINQVRAFKHKNKGRVYE